VNDAPGKAAGLRDAGGRCLSLPEIAMNRFVKLMLSVACVVAVPAVSAPAIDTAPYKVAEGNKVDAQTLKGWRTWRALACERCHGAAQEGMVGPSLVNSLKTLTREQFEQTVLHGRIDKGMPNFDGSKMVVENIDNLYAYLKGRSDGAIQPGRLQEIDK
jgi:mono/diheme cytochrome c family protein